MKLYESGEDYLEAVLMLQKKNGYLLSGKEIIQLL